MSLGRRGFIAATSAAGLSGLVSAQGAGVDNWDGDQILPAGINPNTLLVDPIEPFGYDKPDQEQRKIGQQIVELAPKGPAPLDVAKYFLSSKVPQHYREAWPAPGPWNPVIVEFFSATSYRASTDMVAWCAAFVNWCLSRSRRTASNDPGARSFLDQRKFEQTDSPHAGDLVVYKCLTADKDEDTGWGHVAFFQGIDGDIDLVLGGNQAKGSHYGEVNEARY